MKPSYNEVIEKLRNQKPVLTNPDELTDNIMSSIAKQNSSLQKIVVVLRPWLSAAAVFFIGLFIYQQQEIPPLPSSDYVATKTKTDTTKNSCLDEFLNQGPADRSLLEGYLSCMRQEALENQNTQRLIQKFQQ